MKHEISVDNLCTENQHRKPMKKSKALTHVHASASGQKDGGRERKWSREWDDFLGDSYTSHDTYIYTIRIEVFKWFQLILSQDIRFYSIYSLCPKQFCFQFLESAVWFSKKKLLDTKCLQIIQVSSNWPNPENNKNEKFYANWKSCSKMLQ